MQDMANIETNRLEATADRPYNRRVAGKPKPASQRRSKVLQVRLTPREYRAFAHAAAEAGLSIVAWLRALGIRESRQPAAAKKESDEP
jgi:predicted HicB family RNase H-like nuclease